MVESFWVVDGLARESLLFAGVGLFLGGIDDLLVDLVFVVRRIRRWIRHGAGARLTLETLPPPRCSGAIAVFVAAWDEVAVIGGMLSTALSRYRHDDYRIYVGVYPNDRGTLNAVAAIAEQDARIRIVVGPRNGPTTKADCLNTVWHALCRDDAREHRHTKAIVLHDAEDVVHPQELRVFDCLIDRYDVVQLPVLPLVHQGARLVSGHYADEFAESHAKQIVVRTALGAGMPLAGTGCAIAPEMLARIAHARGGNPFDATSLTEDYELGLRLGELGARCIFARVAADDVGTVVAVRAYFPATIRESVRQKTRWMNGIALAGWDRTGWARPRALADHWMRMRDRRAPLAVVILAVAYAGMLSWAVSLAAHQIAGQTAPAFDRSHPIALWLFVANAILLAWRLLSRMVFTGRSYGVREAFWALPRFIVGNCVALIVAPCAVVRYIAMLRGAAPIWDKTQHEFPDMPAMSNAASGRFEQSVAATG